MLKLRHSLIFAAFLVAAVLCQDDENAPDPNPAETGTTGTGSTGQDEGFVDRERRDTKDDQGKYKVGYFQPVFCEGLHKGRQIRGLTDYSTKLGLFTPIRCTGLEDVLNGHGICGVTTAPADIVFILDSSGSVGSANFKKVLEFVKSVVNGFDIGPNAAKVSVLSFGTSVYPEFQLKDHADKTSVLNAIMKISYRGGSTYTYKALQYARQTSFTKAQGARLHAAKVAIVITDGQSSSYSQTASEANNLRNNGIRIFSIGVGSSVKTSELDAMATDPDSEHVFNVTDFDALKSIKENLQRKTCFDILSTVHFAPFDCQAIKEYDKSAPSKVYKIYPMGKTSPVEVYCDMQTDGGGWTVIQRRFDGSQNFTQTWDAYKRGFGSKDREYWLGNDIIHAIVNNATYKLRIDMMDAKNNTRYAEYSTFRIEDEASRYKLHLGSFKGNVYYDAMASHNQSDFSTSSSCAKYYGAGWWFYSCYNANLNGRYYSGSSSSISYNNWYKFTGSSRINLHMSEMKVKRTKT